MFHYRYASVFDRASSRPGHYDVTVGDDLGDDQWHQIDIERRGNHVVIKLDITRKYLIPRNSRNALDINLDVSVGGLQGHAVNVRVDPSLPSLTLTDTVFKGCFEDVTFEKENILQATKLKSKHVKVIGNLQAKCSEDQEYFPPATLTTPSSFIQLNIARQQNLNLKFKFRTFEHSGVLLHHNLGSQDNERLLLELVKGKLRLNLSSNILNAQLNLSPKTPSLANGLWHKIELNFTHEEIRVQINNEVLEKLLLNISKVVGNLSMKAELRIGSVFSGKSSFIGCVKEIDLNGRKNVMVTSAMTKNVHIDKCHLIDRCFSNPCFNGGHCLQCNNTAQCDCLGTDYQGLQCKEAVKKVLEATKSHAGSSTTDTSCGPLQPTPTSSITSSFTKNSESSIQHANSLINHHSSAKLPSTVTLPLNIISKNGSKSSFINFTGSLTYASKLLTVSSSKPTTTVTTTRSLNYLTYTTIFTSASPVNSFQATTPFLVRKTSITPLPTSTVTEISPFSVDINIPTEETTRKTDQRGIIIIEKRNEVTTAGLEKNQWLVYLFVCVVFLLFVSLIVIISIKISRYPLCECLKRSSRSGRESLSRQDPMELDQQHAKEDNRERKQPKSRSPSSFDDSGIDRSDSGVTSNRSSAEMNEETNAEHRRDSEIWLDCEVTILEGSNESFKKGFLILQEGPPLYTQQTFGWSLEDSATPRTNQSHHEQGGQSHHEHGDQSHHEQGDNSKEISENVEDGTSFAKSPEQRHVTSRYHKLHGEDSSSLENVYIDMKHRESKPSEEEHLCR